MSCENIDEILKWLEEQEKQEDVTVRGRHWMQNLKFQLRCVRIFIKWVKDGFYLHSMRTWIKDVEKCLLQPQRNGSMGHEILEEALSSLSTEPVEKKLKFECHRYFDLGFSILSFGLHDRYVQIDELVLDCIDPLLEILMHLSCCSTHSLQPIEAFTKKLRYLRNFITDTKNELNKVRISIKSDWWQSGDVLTKVKRLLENAVFVSCECWTGSINERIEELCICLEVKINHLELEIRTYYAKFLRNSANSAGNPGIDLRALVSVDSLLDNLQKWLKDQDAGSVKPLDVLQIKSLCHELSFLKYFLLDPHLETKEQTFTSLLIQLESVAQRTSVILRTCVGQTNEINLLNSNMLEILNLLKVEIRKIYQGIPKPSEAVYLQTPNLDFLDVFLQSMDELLKYRANTFSYAKNEIGIVQIELRYMISLVSDKIKKPKEDHELIARCVVDVVHEAEHVIDLISASDRPSWYYVLWLCEVTEKIKMLTKDLTEVEMRSDINVVNVDNSYVHDPQSTCKNITAEEEMVGFQDDAEKLILQLTRGSPELSVVSIVGMPGSGKTTLAKKVYESLSVCYYFHIRCWCNISQAYDRREFLLTLLSCVTELTKEIHEMSNEDLEQRLYRSLNGNRYLLVMDDIWDTWNDNKFLFPNDSCGSRIMFTSENPHAALQVGPGSYLHDLRLFNEEETWELLQKKVFPKRGCPPELYTIGKEIAKCCKGLPLSVVVIAGILKKVKESETHWRKTSESLGNEDGDSRAILELSYKHLPDHLKPCFLYLGTFSNYKEISAKKLIRMWLAKGFVRKTKSAESLEKVAEGYLKDLISRNLVFVAENKSNGGVKLCGLHGLLHEFSIQKARDENFSLIPFHKWLTGEPYARSTLSATSGRKYGLLYDVSMLPYFLRSLRVLDLEHISLESDKFPTEIEQLVHLRYLAIQGRLKYVPPSVANLWRLETFIVKALMNTVVNLPENLLGLAYLKEVYVDQAAFSLYNSFENPFESSGIEILSTVTLCDGNDTTEKLITGLKKSLRKLKCTFLISGDGGFPVLDKLNKLESLNVTYGERSRLVHQPTSCELSFPSTLKKLTLSKFLLPWSEISEKIGRGLPKLEVLKLLDGASEGQRWNVGNDEFLNLKFLKLQGLNIMRWDASPDAFPCLEKLVLQGCQAFRNVPFVFGESTTLQMIKVKQCRLLMKAVRKIHEEQLESRPQGFRVYLDGYFSQFFSQNFNLGVKLKLELENIEFRKTWVSISKKKKKLRYNYVDKVLF